MEAEMEPAYRKGKEGKSGSMIRNILFDMGNVLVRFDPRLFVSRLDRNEEERTLLMREVFLTAEWVMLDRGVLTEDELIGTVRKKLPAYLHEDAGKLVREWNTPPAEVEGAYELAQELTSAGYELYLLTNAGPRHRNYWPGYRVAEYFPYERVFCSAEWKVLKPEQEFYRQALGHFGLLKEECIFIDDSPANAEGACRFGLRSIVFHNDINELRGKLRDAGVTVNL